MNSDEEVIDDIGFAKATTALCSLNTIAAIQKFSRETVGAEISICYSTLPGYEHDLFFQIHPQHDVTVDARAVLMSKLARLLSYDSISVLLPKAGFDAHYTSLTPLSPENIDGVRKFLVEYLLYIDKKCVAKNSSPIFNSFVKLLKDANIEEKENLLLRLAHECDAMDIQLEVEIKRPRIGNN